MAKAKGFARFIPAEAVEYRTERGEIHEVRGRNFLDLIRRYGVLVIKFDKIGADTVVNFVDKLTGKKDWRKKRLEADLQIWYRSRSNEQNRLMWALLSIMSIELYQEHGHEEDLYYEIIDLVSPTSISKLTGRKITKRGSQMNTVEFNRAIEFVFRWFGEHGVELSSAEDIRHYWVEWQNWRWSQKTDPLEGTYRSIEDYRARVTYCEACLKALVWDEDTRAYHPGHEGHIAHIVSRGSGGTDETWNLLHLCANDHLYLQHQNGWKRMVETYPHLEERVKRAQDRRVNGEHLPEPAPQDELDIF